MAINSKLSMLSIRTLQQGQQQQNQLLTRGFQLLRLQTRPPAAAAGRQASELEPLQNQQQQQLCAAAVLSVSQSA